jgi:hypothetical protein
MVSYPTEMDRSLVRAFPGGTEAIAALPRLPANFLYSALKVEGIDPKIIVNIVHDFLAGLERGPHG